MMRSRETNMWNHEQYMGNPKVHIIGKQVIIICSDIFYSCQQKAIKLRFKFFKTILKNRHAAILMTVLLVILMRDSREGMAPMCTCV